jgi:nucleoside-diphosphate-sugar epimerase
LGDKDIIILGGTQLVSFTFVDDMIDALIRFLFSDEPGPIELGNPERVSICDLAREIVWQTGSKSKVRIQYADMKSEKAVDMTGADILRWKATTGIEEGIAKTVEWFRR